jgi:hypothetical protein
MDILTERCGVLRARIGEGDSRIHYINNWLQELKAMEWVIEKAMQTTAAKESSK